MGRRFPEPEVVEIEAERFRLLLDDAVPEPRPPPQVSDSSCSYRVDLELPAHPANQTWQAKSPPSLIGERNHHSAMRIGDTRKTVHFLPKRRIGIHQSPYFAYGMKHCRVITPAETPADFRQRFP